MNKDKAEWAPDADEWRPTRWLAPDGTFNRLSGPIFPFGLGQRSCFGQRLAVLELKACTEALSYSFFFRLVPPEVDNSEVKLESFAKQPRMGYVSLESWN
ncbi:hypothetical protein OPQ81_008193 [Rhizoctonia solani]|nr:hypothetical protein OPQ81_008193 [Rhizoctonia solani]